MDGLFDNRTWPQIDIRAAEDGAAVVEVDVPGVEKDALEVRADADYLVISGKRSTAGGHYSERHSGTFKRRLQIGRGYNVDDIKASHKNGVLTITVPIAKAPKDKKIPID